MIRTYVRSNEDVVIIIKKEHTFKIRYAPFCRYFRSREKNGLADFFTPLTRMLEINRIKQLRHTVTGIEVLVQKTLVYVVFPEE